jgi:hypothetical protein
MDFAYSFSPLNQDLVLNRPHQSQGAPSLVILLRATAGRAATLPYIRLVPHGEIRIWFRRLASNAHLCLVALPWADAKHRNCVMEVYCSLATAMECVDHSFYFIHSGDKPVWNGWRREECKAPWRSSVECDVRLSEELPRCPYPCW